MGKMIKKIASNELQAPNKKDQILSIGLKWQSKWEKENLYQPDLSSAKHNAAYTSVSKASSQPLITIASNRVSPGTAFYNLMMFPYPSAEGLHVGFSYTSGGIDAYGRFMRMKGYEVFEPIGLDGFGIHSENHAIKTNSHPIEHAERTENNFYRQLHATGNAYAWGNKLETYDSGYYRWTQWLFVQLFKSGLAYKKNSPVNFCPSCKTVLSDEQVIDGRCERCDSVVEKRDLEQWFFRITDYAERLLENIKTLNWTEKVKVAQKNWIGRKSGINIVYKIKNFHETVTIFTTRPDTNYGATFIALAPEHELVNKILHGGLKLNTQYVKNIQEYVAKAKNKSEIERQAEGKEKTGVFTGLYALNPLTGYEMPVWISDFVLGGFGTGALVGVPGHDKRDFEFASKFGIEIIRVVVGRDGDDSSITRLEQVQEEDGMMINSGFLNGMDIHDATEKIMEHIERENYGKREVTYHLRDWLISRQRYWGPPIPMIFCKNCADNELSWFTTKEGENRHGKNNAFAKEMAGWYPEEQLPVVLPYLKDFKPLGTGKAPLANSTAFYDTTCPHCGKNAIRETDVSDTFLDSSWYFLRYIATDLKYLPFPMPKQKAKEVVGEKLADNPEVLKEIEVAEKRQVWLPVTSYIGGAEHSVLHLLYARFVMMALYDMGFVTFEEPFARFYAHGLIIKDGAKMSKSKGNVINPDDYIAKYGADTLRTYLLFLGPFDQGGDFRDSGIDGMHRFLRRVWKLLTTTESGDTLAEKETARLKIMHQTIKSITEEMAHLRFNTSIAKLMTWYNVLAKHDSLTREEKRVYLQLLAPFAPYMTEELWEQFGFSEEAQKANKNWSIHKSQWPDYDSKYLVEESLTVAVQINGKLRGTLVIPADKKEDQVFVESLAKEDEVISKFLSDTVRKTIYIPGKILNFVVTV